MELWKLGCRWGSGTPLFYNFIKEKNILIGWVDKDYSLDSHVLVTDGHTVLDIAKVTSSRKSILDFPHLEYNFNELEIPFNNNLFVYDAVFFDILENDRFMYPLQQGIVKVQGEDYRNKFISLKKKYANSKKMNEYINLLKYKKQIILQGPPGTGKTREAKYIAKELLNLSDIKELDKNEQFKILQFHPSYTYEDFVRGIVSKPNEEGDGIIYKAENKILAEFAKKALDNYIDSKKAISTISKEKQVKKYFDLFTDYIGDEIEKSEGFYSLTNSVGLITSTDEDAFRYKGSAEGWLKGGNRMLYKDIIQAYLDDNQERQDIKKNQTLSGLARQHASYFIRVLNLFQEYLKVNNLKFNSESETEKVKLQNYVLIIDEINRANLSSVLGELIYALEYRGEAVESMYEVDGDNKLILPPNLYIIGTMNTADRSVGHIDYAIRRRFAFVDVLPKDLSNEEGILFDSVLFHQVAELFETNLSTEFEKKDVQLGHSYFIDKSKEGGSMNIRLEYEIKPILLEYVKDGVLIGEEIKQKIEELEASI